MDLPCHLKCKKIMDRAGACSFYKEVQPVPNKVIGWVIAANSDFGFNWERIDGKIRDMVQKLQVQKVEKWLDKMEANIRGYCKAYGLSEPEMVREIRPRAQRDSVLRKFVEENCSPGDHLVVATSPYLSVDTELSLFRIMQTIRMIANKGVVLHVTSIDIDFSSPVAALGLRLGHEMSTYARPKSYDDFGDGVLNGRIETVGGMRYEKAKNHKLFQWWVKRIRDDKFSPKELAEHSLKYFRAFAVPMFRDMTVFCLAITKDKASARRVADQPVRLCDHCMITSVGSDCPACFRRTKDPKRTGVSRGLTYRWFYNRDKREIVLADIMRTWELYCDNNPEQNRRPWESRIKKDSD